MKKFFAILAIAGVMISCKDKKTDEKKTEDTTTNTPTTTDGTTTTPSDNTPTSTTTNEVPKFEDAEVQKFVNDYTAIVLDYKNNMTDPVKMQKWAQTSQEWSTKMTNIGVKIANSSAAEQQKWANWTKWLADQTTPKQ